jgi:pantoate--beta-alanine ligase
MATDSPHDFPPDVPIVRSVSGLRDRIAHWRSDGARIALVPTMGALHDGHVSLVEMALHRADRVVVSIFVNPKQFGPREDFSRYPRQEAEDAHTLARARAHLIFAPTVEEMYPHGFATNVSVAGVSEGLCGGARPGHFDGVATVVTKLLLQALPDVAIFGEKDYQQLQVIRRFARDLDIPVEILGAPTVREPDGVALSSRNAYLDPDQRRIAAHIPRVLQAVVDAAEAGDPLDAILAEGIRALEEAGFDTVEYLEIRDADSLRPVEKIVRPARALVAARLGQTRLIDNMAIREPAD